MTPMDFELNPGHGVGPLRFGMDCETARATLASLGGTPLWMCLGGCWSMRRPSGTWITVRFGRSAGASRVCTIVLEAEPDSADTVRWRGIDLFRPWPTVIASVAAHTPLEEHEGFGWAADEFGIYFGLEDRTDPRLEYVSLSEPDSA